MQTCTFFATYTNWLSREIERTDPDLCGSEKPPRMSQQHWNRFKADERKAGELSTTSAPRTVNTAATAPSSIDSTTRRLEKMNEIIKKYELNFSRHLQILLDALNHYAATETVVLLSLCARLSTANQGAQHSNSGLRNADDESRQQI